MSSIRPRLDALNHIELAWAAGVFESEGTVSRAITHGKTRVRAAVTQNGGEEAQSFLRRFVAAVGRGKVLGPYDYSGRYASSSLGKKPRFVVQYQAAGDVAYLMEKLDPYLTPGSPKRERYHELLAEARRERGGEQPS